ncbi:hypothetical protein DFH11DRAFT_1590694 [Phellopilus nigrolimitatus]|nr:hypothetical protein DFH11DRAFT_1590694 [Phellopilus nigrolimitatus]
MSARKQLEFSVLLAVSPSLCIGFFSACVLEKQFIVQSSWIGCFNFMFSSGFFSDSGF